MRKKPKSEHQPNPEGSNPLKAENRRRRKAGLAPLIVDRALAHDAARRSPTPGLDAPLTLSMTAGKA